jgi:UPF0042 nucleotide-binding protein
MIKLVSFGHLHGPAPRADRIEDVRTRLRDPARMSQHLLDSDGFDPAVQAIVTSTPGAEALLVNLGAYCLGAGDDELTVAIGCAGGRHRAPALVELLAKRLTSVGVEVDVDHRDVHLPRVLS